MNKLSSAANIAVYGGGVKEEEFLDRVAKLIGSYDKVTRLVSTRGSGSLWGSGVQTSRHRERILDVDDLAALPKGRSIVLSSGNRATMVETLPWTTGRHAPAVRASIKAHDPESTATLREVETGAREVQAELAATGSSPWTRPGRERTLR